MDNIYVNKLTIKQLTMNYEHEILFYDGEVYYLTSTTQHLNEDDLQFLTDEVFSMIYGIDSIDTYKLNTKYIG